MLNYKKGEERLANSYQTDSDSILSPLQSYKFNFKIKRKMNNRIVRRVVVPKVNSNTIPVLVTTGVSESTETSTVVWGISPCIWRALPNCGVVLFKVRNPITTAAAAFPAFIAVPVCSPNTTVVSENTIFGTQQLPILDSKSTQVVGSDVTVPIGTPAPAGRVQAGYNADYLVEIDKCAGIFRLLGVTAAVAAAAPAAPEVQSAQFKSK